MFWVPNLGPNRWNVSVEKIEYGESAISINNKWMIIATAESHMRMYRDDFVPIQNYIKTTGVECFFRSESFLYECNADSLSPFKDIIIHLKTGIIFLEPKDYIKLVNFLSL